MKITSKLQFFASCPLYLEQLLHDEIQLFEIENIQIERAGISFKCDFITASKIMIQSRIASKVYLSITSFKFRDLNEASTYLNEVWYDKYLNVNQTFKVKTILDRSVKIKDSAEYITLRVKDSIVDFFKEKKDDRPSVEKKDPDQQFLFHVEHNGGVHLGKLYIDLCGSPLSHRGYRQSGHDAPLRENLAASLIKLSGWKPQSESFIDGMSGSGTILIEALLIKGNISPSFMRLRTKYPFSFLIQPWFLKEKDFCRAIVDLFEKVNAENKRKMAQLDTDLYGIEIGKESFNLLHKHLGIMSLDDKSHNLNKDFFKFDPPMDKPGVLILNPPYGKRLQEKELRDLYHDLGETFKKKYKGYRAYIFTGTPELRKEIHLKTDKRIELKNGNIDCRLFEYKMY